MPKMYLLALTLLLALVPGSVSPPLVSTMNGNYIGPALGPQGESPYIGRDNVFHIGPEVGPWELDHLIHSSDHTSTHIFVMFYIPRNKNCKRFMPVWDELSLRFASVPTIDILKLDCSGNQAHACQDHNVLKFPTLQVFRPGLPHGEVFEAAVRADLYSLEQWIHTGIDEPDLRNARAIEPIAGCMAFRRTRACDPRGDREHHKDRECTDEIQNGVEGFCECAEPDHRHHVGCDHPPFSCRDVCVHVPGCAGWRQTGACSPLGTREIRNDLHCQRLVPPGVSGYCECSDGRKVHESTCARTITFTCEDECSHTAELPAPAKGAAPTQHGEPKSFFSDLSGGGGGGSNQEEEQDAVRKQAAAEGQPKEEENAIGKTRIRLQRDHEEAREAEETKARQERERAGADQKAAAVAANTLAEEETRVIREREEAERVRQEREHTEAVANSKAEAAKEEEKRMRREREDVEKVRLARERAEVEVNAQAEAAVEEKARAEEETRKRHVREDSERVRQERERSEAAEVEKARAKEETWPVEEETRVRRERDNEEIVQQEQKRSETKANTTVEAAKKEETRVTRDREEKMRVDEGKRVTQTVRRDMQDEPIVRQETYTMDAETNTKREAAAEEKARAEKESPMKRERGDAERMRQEREHMEAAANAKAEVEVETGKIRMEEETGNRRERDRGRDRK